MPVCARSIAILLVTITSHHWVLSNLVLQLSADPEGKNMCPRILKFNVLFYWVITWCAQAKEGIKGMMPGTAEHETTKTYEHGGGGGF
jgi:hypothetical protein